MRVLMLFVDGVGMGTPDPAVNPLFAARLPVLRSLMGGMPSLKQRTLSSAKGMVLPLDATLGVKGLPQSGTGQASLFAGINGPRRAGHHFGPHPPAVLRPAIERRNIFRQVMEAGMSPCFANAFPERFFEYVRLHKFRLSMTTLSCTLSGLPLLQENDLRVGKALSADLTGEGWKGLCTEEIPVISPAESGRRLAALAAEHHFTLFEYWKTDFAGHSQQMADAVLTLERLDEMLGGVLEAIDLHSALIVLTSDHGNIEDLSVRTHTRNPVPLMLCGSGFQKAAARIASRSRPNLAHVTPLLMDCMKG